MNIDELKTRATELQKETEKQRAECLDIVARENGFENWPLLMKNQFEEDIEEGDIPSKFGILSRPGVPGEHKDQENDCRLWLKACKEYLHGDGDIAVGVCGSPGLGVCYVDFNKSDYWCFNINTLVFFLKEDARKYRNCAEWLKSEMCSDEYEYVSKMFQDSNNGWDFCDIDVEYAFENRQEMTEWVENQFDEEETEEEK